MHTAAGGRVEAAYWPRQVRPVLRGRERLVGQREEAEGRGAEGDLVRATRSLRPRRALCLPSQPCAAWPGACSAKPTGA
ncbi:unnamed protein product [Rangifer tarandus platyrhynchus]|uniref:Uncharacterized protein n=1 Tax=Rangifer tarandus platyrhynchus TaxID=3082113 RepID=A0AC59Y771_RANTA